MSEHQIELTVDGERETVTVAGRTLLVHALRDQLGVTSPKVGCETGKCGACTVDLDGDAVKSCMVLAAQADGATIRTAAARDEDGLLEHVQDHFHEAHGLQCGYCTPGMVTTVTEFLRANPNPTEDEIRQALKGNICRCTGYTNIVRAVKSAADELEDTVEDGAITGTTGPDGPATAPEGDD